MNNYIIHSKKHLAHFSISYAYVIYQYPTHFSISHSFLDIYYLSNLVPLFYYRE